jgi:DNA-binding transcriptional LysR family regulator
MELRHLRSFVAVADELHFGRAAAALYMSTSALSEQISALERDVGTPLLVRSSRRVELTAAGRRFLPDIRHALADLENGRLAARRAVNTVQPELRLGWPAVSNPIWIERIVSAYRDTHPDVQVRFAVHHSASHARAVADGQLDVAFVYGKQDSEAGLSYQRLSQWPLRLVCSEDHPLASKAQVDIEDLRSATHVAFERELNPPLYRRIYEALLADATHVVEHSSLEAVLGIVASSDTVALRVEDTIPTMTQRRIVCRELDAPPFRVELGLTWRADAPLIAAFITHAETMSRLTDKIQRPEIPNLRPEVPR